MVVIGAIALMAAPGIPLARAPAPLSDCRSSLVLMSATVEARAQPRVRRDSRARPAVRPCLTLAST